MSDPRSCTKCGNLLADESASGLCPACAPAEPATKSYAPPAPAGEPSTVTHPGAPPNNTPNAAADPTPISAASAHPDLNAPTHTAPDGAATVSGPPVAPDEPLPRDPVGFTLICRIGKGGMGEVFRAHETSTGKFVALKMMDTKRATGAHFERFQLEFRALANLEHPHVVRVFKDDLHHAPPFFTMEELPGGTVAQRLRQSERYEPREAVELIRKVATAVQALHDFRAHMCLAGVIHRDIKPGNILLTREGEPKLADFGLVKYLDAETLTRADAALGTPAYMPPEQCAGLHEAMGYPADVYGLGATLYHMLTGEPPFRGTLVEIIAQVLNNDPRPVRELVPEVDAALGRIVRGCMHKRPDDRYQTVGALLADLDKWLADGKQRKQVAPPEPTRATRARRWAQRNAAALSACALLATCGAALALWPKPEPPKWPKHGLGDVPPQRPWVPAAVSPLSLTLRPDLTYEQVRADLRSGKRVALVSDTGARVPLGRGIGPCEVEAGRKPGEGFLLKSRGLSVVQLLGTAGAPQYTIRGQFREDRKAPNAAGNAVRVTQAGLALGYVRASDGDTVAHFLVVLTFGEPVNGQVRELCLGTVGLLEHPLAPVVPSHDFPIRFPLNPRPEEGWRELEARVEPTGITVRYNGQTKTYSAVHITHEFARRAADLRSAAKDNPQGIVAPEWSPDLPLGLWAWDAWASVRNVTIEP